MKSLFGLVPGKFAVFKAIVVGTPPPTVTWGRANGEIIYHPAVCQQRYDEASHEHTLEVSFTCKALAATLYMKTI